MITAKIGKAVFTPKKDYQPGDLCLPLDVVAFNGSLWACLEETRELPAQDSLFWMHLLDGGTARVINTEFPLTGGRSLADDLTLALAEASEGDTLVFRKGKWTIAQPYEICQQFYYRRHPTLKTGFAPAHGGLIQDASVKYPEAWEYLLSEEGQILCKTEAEWQAMTTATWATLADGTKIGWSGIGGAPFYAPNPLTGDLRLPDLRGMFIGAAGFDSLGVGGVHGDATRPVTGYFDMYPNTALTPDTGGVCSYVASTKTGVTSGASAYKAMRIQIDSRNVVPVANANKPRAWGALACVYLGQPAS